MPRIHLPSPEDMTPEQRVVHDEIVTGVRGRLVGPLRAVLHSPDLARRWSRLGEFLRFSTCLPKKLNELAIIVTGRRWNSQLEFLIHSEAAMAAGLAPAAIEAIRVAQAPSFTDEAEAEVYEFARMLQQTADVDPAAHAAVTKRWGERGVVELTGVIGYYTMVSMTLNAHEIPLPDGAIPPLALPPGGGLTTMPPCKRAGESTASSPRMPAAPRVKLPDGACDCHTHVFGPYDRFPVVHQMHYEAPLAPAALHREMLDRVGLARGIVIQPGAYGSDAAALLDALNASGGRLRGIAVADRAIASATLDAWHTAGVRGLRFNDMTIPGGTVRFSGSVGTDELAALAPRLRPRGWHAEVWATADQHAASLAHYRAGGLPVALDHMAGVIPARGLDDPAFREIIAALAEGWLWIKLSLCRCSQDFPDYPDLKPFHDALVAARPDRLIWGSDWPYLRLAEKTPDVGHVLDLFNDWVPDAATRELILSTNPAQLYDF
jgi:2-pyrone-4,6-dicarboxylate lactonase